MQNYYIKKQPKEIFQEMLKSSCFNRANGLMLTFVFFSDFFSLLGLLVYFLSQNENKANVQIYQPFLKLPELKVLMVVIAVLIVSLALIIFMLRSMYIQIKTNPNKFSKQLKHNNQDETNPLVAFFAAIISVLAWFGLVWLNQMWFTNMINFNHTILTHINANQLPFNWFALSVSVSIIFWFNFIIFITIVFVRMFATIIGSLKKG